MEYHEIDPIHAHMAIYRAVENGVTVVRQADNGLSFVVDPYGRVVSTMDHWTASERVSLAQVPFQSAFTIYPYIGDLFAWLSIAGFVAITVWAVVRRRGAKRVPKSPGQEQQSEHRAFLCDGWRAYLASVRRLVQRAVPRAQAVRR